MTDNVVGMPQSALSIVMGDDAYLLPVSVVRKIATGQMSIAEMDNPEGTAQALAIIAMESINAD